MASSIQLLTLATSFQRQAQSNNVWLAAADVLNVIGSILPEEQLKSIVLKANANQLTSQEQSIIVSALHRLQAHMAVLQQLPDIIQRLDTPGTPFTPAS
jgi:hypothetical protein